MIVNLTPHSMHIYAHDTPDRIDPTTTHECLVTVIPASDQDCTVRLGHTVVTTGFVVDGIPVEDVAFGADTATIDWLPEPVPGTRYLVSLFVGLAADHRDDLLVPHDYVRDMSGSIIGSRRLARPTPATSH